ncbi:hypothetical protein [uncultured Chryseobacterium sp.]|uniref:HD domain-containing protein n=1 Tax=uncultured Chryseobacterium sp. TaxID=259322 RepID=UPI0025E1B275|nr:hypothetical protein [uncultured Chryseobacterium sp.]
MTLQERFRKTCAAFSADYTLIDNLWSEIENLYTEKSRYYHTLEHLEHMLRELDSVKDRIQDTDLVSLSVFYHDAVYDASSKSNEKKSAALAEKRLGQLQLNPAALRQITEQIIATQLHECSDSADTNYLLDADLSVLGKDSAIYQEYAEKIRKEYSIYPDFLYRPGRKKVLRHFLDMDRIFKTEEFIMKYEHQARENIRSEWETL